MFLGLFKYKVAEWSQKTSPLYVFLPNMVDLIDLKIINAILPTYVKYPGSSMYPNVQSKSVFFKSNYPF